MIAKIQKHQDLFIILTLTLAVLASRLLFLNSALIFFDSPEYAWRSNSADLFSAISSGHPPYHPGYILFTWLSNYLLNHLNIHDLYYAMAMPSAIFGSLTVVFFYLLVKKIFNFKIAILSAVLVAITPYFWIANITILVDPVMIFFYILSLYLFYIWLEKKNYIALLAAGFAFGFAIWTHTQIIFWSLGFVALFIYMVKPKDWLKMFGKSLLFLIGPVFFIWFYLFLLVKSGNNPTYLSALNFLLFGNAGDHLPLSLKPGLTNYIYIMTALGALFSLLGFIKLLINREKQKFILLFLWLAPGLIISALYIYANLYGRSSMICIFPAMVAVSYFLLKWPNKNWLSRASQILLIVLIVSQLLVISLPIVMKYANEPGVYQDLGNNQLKLEPGGLYIASNLGRTTTFYKNYDVLWETPQSKIISDIETNLNNNKPVYLGQDAIMFGFYKYDGDNWEISSTALGGPGGHLTLAADLFARYNFSLAAASRYDNKTAIFKLTRDNQSISDRIKNNLNNLPDNQALVMGQSVPQNLINIYSNQTKYIISPEHLNYRDFIYYLYNVSAYKIKKSDNFREPLIFTYADRSGFFTATLPKTQSQDINLEAISFDLSKSDIFSDENSALSNFDSAVSKNQNFNIVSEKTGTVDNVDEILGNINPQNSFYLVLDKEGQKINYHLYFFEIMPY